MQEGDCDHDDHADENVKIEMEGTEGLLEGLADRPEEPEENKEEDGMGGSGRNKDEGEGAPPFPLKDKGGFQLQDGEEEGAGLIRDGRGRERGGEKRKEKKEQAGHTA